MREVSKLSKQHPTPRGVLAILSDISFTLWRGDSASIMGPSGSGKSTLLYVLGALEPPTAGTVTFEGENRSRWMSERSRRFATRALGSCSKTTCCCRSAR